jgi:imidazoleglycerol-phosphate dehydratase
MPRVASIHRTTNETEVRVKLNLDGRGKARISTGIRFFDHMLELVTRHGGFDLKLSAKGDLVVDKHKRLERLSVKRPDSRRIGGFGRWCL